MSWLLDADVLSQPAKRRGDARVIGWLEQECERCYTSSIVIAQLAFWVRSKEGRQRDLLQAWLHRLTESMHGRVLGFTVAVAYVWADQQRLLEQAGQLMPVEDSYIAAIARRHNLTIVTGNEKDFDRPGLKVLNPFRAAILACSMICLPMLAATYEVRPGSTKPDQTFEAVANNLKQGDELIVHAGVYSLESRRAVSVKGTAERPILIRAGAGEAPLFTTDARHNCIEFVDCSHLVVRGLHFRGGSSGVRFIRGDHITFEDCEIAETQNNALTMNSGNCHAFIIRGNHIHHTGLSESHPTEGEGMYIGCHSGSCRTTDSLIEGNYIHHLRGTSDGGNDGIEIKTGSFGNVIRNNVIHDTNIGRRYPGIFVYGGGDGVNIVEGNAIWNAGEGIQVVSDAIVRNNIIFNCLATGITAAPHSAMPRVRNTTIVHNTIYNAPTGVRLRWASATNAVFANNAIFCPTNTALDCTAGAAVLRGNCVGGQLNGIGADGRSVIEAGGPMAAFGNAAANNFWLRRGSSLIGKAAPEFAVDFDFNGTKRTAPSDVGAYEAGLREQNPGWLIKAGFKR